LKWIKEEALYGREITSTARIAKMNMIILFGDGHSNIQQMDSLERPVIEEYNIVLSNIPYSQDTEFHSLYGIGENKKKNKDSENEEKICKNADPICMKHIWDSLKPNGRAAVIVPESFLYEGGDIGIIRKLIVSQSKKCSVVSLPRGVFMPYTPTKTNILFFQKGGQFEKAYFFVIHNDGFELNTKRKPVEGYSDIKKLLSEIDEPSCIAGQANIVVRKTIEESENWNLRPFYYMEDIIQTNKKLIPLNSSIIEEVNERFDGKEHPDGELKILEVSQNGIFLGDILRGYETTQKYKPVRTGDIVYNPYRINIGSIGVVPPYLDKSYVSPAYVVIRCVNPQYSPFYIVSILKHPRFLKIIMNYSISSARANLPFSELIRIKIPKLSEKDNQKIKILEKELFLQLRISNNIAGEINNLAKNYCSE
jgi:hypothetical protein